MQTNLIVQSDVHEKFVADCTVKVIRSVCVARFLSYRYLVVFEADLRTRKSKFTHTFHKEESPIYHYASEELRSARVCANLVVIMINKRFFIVYCGPK